MLLDNAKARLRSQVLIDRSQAKCLLQRNTHLQIIAPSPGGSICATHQLWFRASTATEAALMVPCPSLLEYLCNLAKDGESWGREQFRVHTLRLIRSIALNKCACIQVVLKAHAIHKQVLDSLHRRGSELVRILNKFLNTIAPKVFLSPVRQPLT